MFWVQELEDVVRIEPRDQQLPREKLIIQIINNKLSNRVLLNIGLCICVWDLVKINEAYILQSDGMIAIKVTFREVIFRPFSDEILTGKIKDMDETGVVVSLDFFNEVFISADNLSTPSSYDGEKWIWWYEDEDDEEEDGPPTESKEKVAMPMWRNNEIRVSVLDVQFYDKKQVTANPNAMDEPVPLSSITKMPKLEAGTAPTGLPPSGVPSDKKIADLVKESSFVVTAHTKNEGLGMLAWWS